jgi:hypothetical protein
LASRRGRAGTADRGVRRVVARPSD